MITVTDKSGFWAGVHAIAGAVALVVLAPLAVPPTSLLTALLALAAVAVAVWQLQAGVRFMRAPERQTARRMLHVSLLHLPLTLLLVLCRCWL